MRHLLIPLLAVALAACEPGWTGGGGYGYAPIVVVPQPQSFFPGGYSAYDSVLPYMVLDALSNGGD